MTHEMHDRMARETNEASRLLQVQATAHFDGGLPLDCGETIAPVDVAYCTYGTLNREKDNAILICHALTGDQYVAGLHPVTGKSGWWSQLVGPGKAIDTDKYFIICSNVLGGCMGSTGPRSPRPQGTCWGTDFPPITIKDMVRAQAMLLTYLGIDGLFAVIGGSMGGMQVLEWVVTYPERVSAAIPIATSPYHSAQNIAFNEVSRQAIFADPDWCDGRYWAFGKTPARGLAVARMMAHITYMSEGSLTQKFGRRTRGNPVPSSPGLQTPISFFDEIFEVESYLRYQGSRFVTRFDANAYLTITRALDYFDLAAVHEGDLSKAFADSKARFCVVSFSSDWLFPTSQSRVLARALIRAGVNVSFVEIDSDRGHDAFLLEEPEFERTIRGFLEGACLHHGFLEGRHAR